MKFIFPVAAAGLGASFGALFDVRGDLRAERFDPKAESAHWMKVGRGFVTGLALTEIFQTGNAAAGEDSAAGPALLALVGGSSAGLLHIALSRLVNAVKSLFAPLNEH